MKNHSKALAITFNTSRHSDNSQFTFDVGVVEEGVQVRQERVTHVEHVTGSLGEQVAESGRVLLAVSDTVVITGERVESSKLHPTLAQLLAGVSVETADVGADLSKSLSVLKEVRSVYNVAGRNTFQKTRFLPFRLFNV